MTAHHFIVARQGGQWKVSYHGTEQGPFTDKDEAIAAAINAGRDAHAEGKDVEVLVQDIESNFHKAWSSGVEEDGTSSLSSSS